MRILGAALLLCAACDSRAAQSGSAPLYNYGAFAGTWDVGVMSEAGDLGTCVLFVASTAGHSTWSCPPGVDSSISTSTTDAGLWLYDAHSATIAVPAVAMEGSITANDAWTTFVGPMHLGACGRKATVYGVRR